MSAYYFELRALHIACVFVSLALFVLRHVLNVRGVAWRQWRSLTIMPHVVDSVLLASGFALAFTIEQYPFATAWLTAKLIALVGYIVLGAIALKRGRTPAIRRIAFIGAALVFAFMISIARTHSPIGIFSQYF